MFAAILLLGFLAIGVLAQSGTASSASAQTTMNLFIGNNQGEGFVGSAVCADSSASTYAIACTSGSYSLGALSGSCNPQVSATVIYGPNSYEASTQVSANGANGAKATVVETCSLSGTTEAACGLSISISAQGTKTSTSTSFTLSGTELVYHQVPITAGADKLSNHAACTSSGNAAAATGVVEVYKILVVPGVAALVGALA